MKRLLAGAALAACLASPAVAVEVWQGDLFVTVATPACDSGGFAVDNFFRSIYRPAGLEDNGSDARLVLLGSRNAQHITIDGPLKGAASYHGFYFSGGGGLQSWDATVQQGDVKPANVTVDTKYVLIKVKVNVFANIPGCSVTLEGALGNRPNL